MAIRFALAGVISATALLAGCGGEKPAGEPAASATPGQAAITQSELPPIGSAVAINAKPPEASAPTAIPPPPADPLAVGSQAAKDEMYCSAVIYAENPDVPNALAPIDEALLRKAQMLGFAIGEAGINHLVEEKAIHATHARMVSEAYAAQAEKDLKKKKPRISLDECNRRAGALPIPQ